MLSGKIAPICKIMIYFPNYTIFFFKICLNKVFILFSSSDTGINLNKFYVTCATVKRKARAFL